MIIESGNVLPLGKRKTAQYESYTRRERRYAPPDNAVAARVFERTRELPDTDCHIAQHRAASLSWTRFSSRDSACSTKLEYRRAILPHLKFSILRIRAGYVGLPGKFFPLLRVCARLRLVGKHGCKGNNSSRNFERYSERARREWHLIRATRRWHNLRYPDTTSSAVRALTRFANGGTADRKWS